MQQFLDDTCGVYLLYMRLVRTYKQPVIVVWFIYIILQAKQNQSRYKKDRRRRVDKTIDISHKNRLYLTFVASCTSVRYFEMKETQ